MLYTPNTLYTEVGGSTGSVSALCSCNTLVCGPRISLALFKAPPVLLLAIPVKWRHESDCEDHSEYLVFQRPPWSVRRRDR